jgi:hypothetical protein
VAWTSFASTTTRTSSGTKIRRSPKRVFIASLEAVEAYNRQFLAEFAEIHYEQQELIDANDSVVANMRIHGRGKASGATFELSAWWVFTSARAG